MSTIMISDTTQNISYANTLNSVTKRETLNDSSEAWIQYLRDHRKLIREHSDHVTVELSTMIKYKYRPRKYLLSVNTSYVELETAFRVANRFYSDEEFNENVTDVYIPNINYITELRKMYTTVNSRSNKL